MKKLNYHVANHLWACILGLTLGLVGITILTPEFWFIVIPTVAAVAYKDYYNVTLKDK